MITAKSAKVGKKTASRSKQAPASQIQSETAHLMQQILPEELFLGMLCLERKRAERSRRKFLLILLDSEQAARDPHRAEVLKGMARAAYSARRETDLAGWYKHNLILGLIFTELGSSSDTTIMATLVKKVQDSLNAELSESELRHVRLSFHLFADDGSGKDPDVPANTALYPDLFHHEERNRVGFLVKRAIDILGSLAALTILSPLFLLIAIAVKCSSKGPIFFRQERLGQFGKSFTFLKFRSMYAQNDPKIHQDFMKRLIAGSVGAQDGSNGKAVYKMKDDPRITRIGRVLRRTSLDEVPQFINVLRGDMSLVGPRPPLPYEYEEYDVWHRRRVLEIRPGITGLWQVKGRSRVRFDDMVRLDLQYARQWSVWLDLRILLETPRAVFLGDGAF